MNPVERIKQFLLSVPRFKIAVITDLDSISDLSILNIGEQLGIFLKDNIRLNDNDLQFVIQEELSRLFYQNISKHKEFGKYICLSNFGILFEKELGIDPFLTIKRLSKNTLVIILWEGIIKHNTLYFLTEKSKYKLDLSEINHIIVS